jgi:dipeptidyl aminopeptidase/acylaminoacyl peptidase
MNMPKSHAMKRCAVSRYARLLKGLIISGLLSSHTLGTPLILQAAEPPALIPRKVLFGNPDIAGVTLSPDGDRIAYLAPYQGVLNLWVRDLDGTNPPRLLTQQTSRPHGVAYWTYDGRYLISSRDSDGDENTVLIRIDPTNGASLELTPSQGVSAIIVAGSDKDAPNEIVVGLNDRNPRYHDLYTLKIDSGERELLYRSRDDGSRVMVERINGVWQPVLQVQVLPDGGITYELWSPSDSSWRPFKRFTFEDTISGSGPLGFTRDGNWLYGILTTDDDLPRLVRWSRDQLHACEMTCKPELVHRSTSGVLSIALTNIDNGTPILLQETDLRSRRVILDSSLKRDLDELSQLTSGKEFVIAGRDRHDKTWLVAIGSDQQGPQYWLWNRDQQQIRKLFSVQPLLDQYNLVPMESLNLTARDGLRLPTYLTRTPITNGEPQPLVLIVHGGPQSRDYWDLDPMHQLLANRGYHVMSVNYRGSTGFGKGHLLAGEGEWYARMQDDLVDAVRWAVDQRIADPNRLVIMGSSYGGYAALSGITRDPDLFAAAIAEVAPSNLRTLLDSIPASWESDRAILERMIGVGKVDLDAISPINHVDRIRRPLLLAHGANDPRVNLAESELIAAEMESRGLTVDFVVFPNEGHGLVDPRNALAMVALVEAFLQQHIGGRSEPFGSVLNSSSMDWRLRSAPIK